MVSLALTQAEFFWAASFSSLDTLQMSASISSRVSYDFPMKEGIIAFTAAAYAGIWFSSLALFQLTLGLVWG